MDTAATAMIESLTQHRFRPPGLRLPRSGLSLMELLVVIAILSTLIGLLLPAVQAAREAARRIQCQNNFRQMGLALHQFHDVFGVFPASGWTKSGPGNPQGRFVGWQVMILPMLEQQTVLTRYDRGSDWWATGNLQQGAVGLSVYRCPSSPIDPQITFAAAKAPRPALYLDLPLAPSDYAALMGIRASINPILYAHSDATRAVMHRNSTVRFADILDGTSHSITITECTARPQVYRRRLPQTELVNDQGYGWIDSESGFSLDGASADGVLQGLGPKVTPVAINATNENEPYSFHPGGCYMLFADGHVSFLSETTDLAIVAALITRAGGEVP